MTNAPLSKRLREARSKTPFNQQQLGEHAGLDEENAGVKINQYERGVHIPKFPRLKDLAKALQIPTAFFYAESDELAELIYHYEKLDPLDRQKILSIIRK